MHLQCSAAGPPRWSLREGNARFDAIFHFWQNPTGLVPTLGSIEKTVVEDFRGFG